MDNVIFISKKLRMCAYFIDLIHSFTCVQKMYTIIRVWIRTPKEKILPRKNKGYLRLKKLLK